MSQRLAVITGATSGIGAAYAEAFAEQAWNYKLLVFLVWHLPMSWLFAALGRSKSARFTKGWV